MYPEHLCSQQWVEKVIEDDFKEKLNNSTTGLSQT